MTNKSSATSSSTRVLLPSIFLHCYQFLLFQPEIVCVCMSVCVYECVLIWATLETDLDIRIEIRLFIWEVLPGNFCMDWGMRLGREGSQ